MPVFGASSLSLVRVRALRFCHLSFARTRASYKKKTYPVARSPASASKHVAPYRSFACERIIACQRLALARVRAIKNSQFGRSYACELQLQKSILRSYACEFFFIAILLRRSYACELPIFAIARAKCGSYACEPHFLNRSFLSCARI